MNRNMAAMAQMLAQRNAQPAKPIVQFKAGLMDVSGGMVKADERRGTVKLVVTPDGVLHLQWTERPTGQLQPSNDIMLLPKTAIFEKVPECETGRVYVLRFKGSSRKRFFWMQDVTDEDDEENCKKINESIEDPPKPDTPEIDPNMLAQLGISPEQAAALAGRGGGGGMGGMAGLMEAFGAGAGAGRSGATSSGASSGPVVTSTSGPPGSGAVTGARGSAGAGAGAGAGGASGAGSAQAVAQQLMAQYAAQLQAQQQAQGRSLEPVLAADRVLPHVDEKMIDSLVEFLPESQRNAEHLRATLRSPQLRQTVGRLSALLNSEQFGEVMSSLGLPHRGDIGVDAFLAAIQALADKEKEKDGDGAEKDKDTDKDQGSGDGSGSGAAPMQD